MILAGGLSMIGGMVSQRLKSKFQKYAKVAISSGLSGAEVAQEMLRAYGIDNVRIVQGKGFLTDHYNPMSRTVSLSPAVFQGRNISAAAVAAHEVGHAVQHATGYAALQMRSALVPLVKAASVAQQWLLLLALMAAGTMPQLLLIVIAAFAVTCLFSLITLPVEFDASRRALNWLEESRVTVGAEHEGAKDALWWAAMTYVAGALSSLVMLLYLIAQFNRRRR